jgi:hypothetical protein
MFVFKNLKAVNDFQVLLTVIEVPHKIWFWRKLRERVFQGHCGVFHTGVYFWKEVSTEKYCNRHRKLFSQMFDQHKKDIWPNDQAKNFWL